MERRAHIHLFGFFHVSFILHIRAASFHHAYQLPLLANFDRANTNTKISIRERVLAKFGPLLLQETELFHQVLQVHKQARWSQLFLCAHVSLPEASFLSFAGFITVSLPCVSNGTLLVSIAACA